MIMHYVRKNWEELEAVSTYSIIDICKKFSWPYYIGGIYYGYTCEAPCAA
jgi:hypothetical protein